MTIQETGNRAPFAEQTMSLDKQHEGRAEAFETHLEIRKLDGEVDDALHAWVHERLGRQLGKYAGQIERIEVRFGDENGPKGGIDRCCMVHTILSSLPPIVVEMRGGEDREAFDLAAGRAERALKRSMQKHGFSSKHKGRQRGKHGASDVENVQAAMLEQPTLLEATSVTTEADAPLYDKRVGRTHDNLLQVQQGTDGHPDTAQPGVSADMQKVGEGHTAVRNAKLNTEGFAYELEDSTNGRPSRKSTRAGKNRLKHGQALALRTKTAVHSPSMRAQRASRG
jgi:putative sigma-54 modulation protein